MKKTIIFQQCIFCVLFCITSCSKEQKIGTNISLNQQNNKGPVGQTSSIVGYYKDNTTTVTSINIYPGNQKKVLYSIGPLTVSAGDVVSAHFQQELTYTGSYNAMAGSSIVVGTSASVLDNTSAGYVGWIARPATSNLSVDEEISMEVMGRTGSFQFTSAATNIYINAVCYAASTQNVPDFTVPAGAYGELVAVVESGVGRYTTSTYNLPFSSSANKYYVPNSPILNVQYALGPLNIPAGTMVDTRFDIEATSEVPLGSGSQRLGRQLIQGTSATSTTGLTLTKQIQAGITKGEHHWTASHVGGAYYPTAVNGAYFNSVLYSYGWNGEPLYIEGPGTNLYGHMVVETRPYAGFWEDLTYNFTSATATPQVLYSVGPIDIAANQVVEVRYQAAFSPTAGVTVDSKIVRASSPTATSGTTIQPPLARRFHNNYTHNNIVLSTAEQPSTAQTGQYYNVVVWRIGGASTCPVNDWGELEVVKR